MGKKTRIGGDIRMRSAPDGRLINQYDFIKLFCSDNFSNLSDRDSISGTELIDEVRCENIHNKGGLS